MTLRQQFLKHVGQTSPSPLLIEVARAEGVFFYTPEGKRYFDLVSGVSVSNVGHNNPRVVEAVQRQAADYMHVMVYGEMVERPQVRLAALVAEVAVAGGGLLGEPSANGSAGTSAENGTTSACVAQAEPMPSRGQSNRRLDSAEAQRRKTEGQRRGEAHVLRSLQRRGEPTGRQVLDSLYFVNSGAEAVEVALKLAKRSTGRTELVSCTGAYHGSTHGALSVQGGEQFRNAFRPLLPDTRQVRFNNFSDLALITERTACFIVEPVQGEAGIRLPAEGYLEAARKRCDEVGAMLIFDEVQTGFGRCGAMFAFQKYGVIPDAVCLGKAFGGGMPLGGVLAPKATTDLFTSDPALGHITTFGGHPICCAAGLAALEYNLEHDLPAAAETMGALFESELKRHPAVREVRRSGLLMAVELGDAGRLQRTMHLFVCEGILSDWFLFCDTAFRISPPLTITAGEVRECCAVIRRIMDKL